MTILANGKYLTSGRPGKDLDGITVDVRAPGTYRQAVVGITGG